MKSLTLVVLQSTLAAALVLSARPNAVDLIAILLVVIGFFWGAWAVAAVGVRNVRVMPEANERTQLVTTGPFRFVRHPMYTGLSIACVGFSLMPFHPWKGIALAVLIVVLVLKSNLEEEQLSAQFAEYEAYQKRTKRVIPFVI